MLSTGPGRTLGREEPPRLQARLVALSQDRAFARLDQLQRRLVRLLAIGVADRIGRCRQCPQGELFARCPAHHHFAITQIEVAWTHFE